MSQVQIVEKENYTPEALNELIIDSIQDIKGKEIVKLDLRSLDESPANYFIICNGESTTQVRAISNNICKRLKYEADVRPNHVEGDRESKWILVDFFNVVVHIFYPETRAFYELEDLWSDAAVTAYDDI